MTTAESPVEVELKFRVADAAAAERYLEAESIGPFGGGAVVRSTRMEDQYLDTSKGAFAKGGYAVRLRQSGRGTIVSVKSLARTTDESGAVRREELEGPADRAAGPLDWPTSDARSLVLELAGDAPLVEVVTVRQLRRRRIVRQGETRVELSVDDVEVVSHGQILDRFVELEAELVRGDAAALGDLAAAFANDPALVAESTSKYEAALTAIRADDRGRRARDQAAAVADPAQGLAADVAAALVAEIAEGVDVLPTTSDVIREAVEEAVPPDNRLVVGKTPGVSAEDHVAEAGRKVLRFHLARMLAREAGTRAGLDPEELHAMRVATRRQRAAWRVFGTSFRAPRTRRYRRGLREIAGRLGAVRDLDVLLEAADHYRADLPVTEQRGLEPLLSDWRTRRDDARILLIRELDSDGYRRWVDDYRDFVRTEGLAVLPVGPTEPHRIRDTAASRIWAAYEHVRGYEPVLRWADVETLHELRIAGKWLRYTLEFVREALGDEASPLIARVTALQDHLGLMNDANVSAGLARTFLVEHAGELSTVESAAIGRYLVSREREVARLRRTIATPWRGVAGVGFRRSLGRVVSGL